MQLNQRGVTLQTVVLAGVLTLAATGLGIVIYNLIADRSGDIESSAVDIDFLEPIGFEPRPFEPGPNGGGLTPLPNSGVPPRAAGEEPETEEVLPETEEEEEETEEVPPQADDEEDILDDPTFLYAFHAHSLFTATYCAVHFDGTISCWGRGDSGQLGDGRAPYIYQTLGERRGSNEPVKVVGINDAVAVSVGVSHTCALHRDTTISCWGMGYPNVLGNTYRHSFNKPLKIMDSEGNPRTGFAQVGAGYWHTCARYTDDHPKAGRITCWGSSYWGALGNNDDNNFRSPDYKAIESNPDILSPTTPDEIFVEVLGIDDAVDLSVGKAHNCVLHRDKSVSCWGDGTGGISGDGKIADRNSPVKVVDSKGQVIRDFEKITAGPTGTCGVRKGSVLWCWGELHQFPSIYGKGSKFTPTRISDFKGLEKLARVKDFTFGNSLCAVLASDDSVWCWGAATFLSDDSPDQLDLYVYNNPRQISNIQSPLDIATLYGSNCFLLADNTVVCDGGNNLFGQLAEGHRIEDVMALGT